ncbi:MAG TPA: 30S ribosomal protein S17 [Patescibacteria group bacterium]|jgi:small subunit ribosomal protein S17|nr:30S ribosomal protein S17 [Patescibacteria group bacterium]
MIRTLTGTVTSDVQDKTIVVRIDRRVMHPIYNKQYKVTKKFAAHDESNQAHIGDQVEIVESRPISKRKAWRLSRVVVVNVRNKAAEVKEPEA